ncbi:MAG: hypothetical protein WC812_04140 [Candidatus Pacearchaeota archaeon]|jgi:quercetin dioxygenase-like cupin family protein
MKIIDIHEDKRGYIKSVEGLLDNQQEFTFMEIKKGRARGGCYHTIPENFVVIKGQIKYIYGQIDGPYEEKILNKGNSGTINPKIAHAFVGLEDSIVSEWGVTTSEKIADVKDPKLRKIVEDYNKL